MVQFIKIHGAFYQDDERPNFESMGINVDNSFELFEWKPIYVNVNNIFEIYINKSGTTHISTFNAEFGVTCRETPEEVIELINKGQ